MRDLHIEGIGHVCIIYDISKAHRRVPVLRAEWDRQACQVLGTAASALKLLKRMRAAEDRLRAPATVAAMAPDRFVLEVSGFTEDALAQTVWLNTVGTFGVGSARYWWGRAGAALFRLAHYLQGCAHMLWLLLYSDDCWRQRGGSTRTGTSCCTC